MPQFMGLNPWLTMWSQPRPTIRAIVYSKPSYGTFWLSTIYALQSLFFFANWASLGLKASFESIFLLCLLSSPILGLIWLYAFGGIFYVAARILGGQAPYAHVRSAMAWSHIPSLIGLVLWFVLLSDQSDTTFVLAPGETATLFIAFISLVVVVWVTVLIIRSFAEIQGFPIWKSILNIALGLLIYFILLFVISFVYSYLFVK